MWNENQTINNRLIPPYMTGALKHSMHDLGTKKI